MIPAPHTRCRDKLSAIDRQGESSTADRVDGLREQARLEQLLPTPFRHRPLHSGSRFARMHQLAAVGRFTVAFGSPHPTPANGLDGDDRRGDAMRERRIQAFEVPSARSGGLTAQFTMGQFLMAGRWPGPREGCCCMDSARQARRQISRHTEDLPLTLLRFGMQVAQKKLGLHQLLSPAPSHHHPGNRISALIDLHEHLTQLFKLS